MDSYRRQQIQARAQNLLDEAGITKLPVVPRLVAAHLDIAVQAKPPHISGASGWLIRVGDDFLIVYATHIDSEGFQNFSVAHELGHYCLDGHPEHIFRSGSEHQSRAGFGSIDPIEQEADYFAACLLMPSGLCRPLVDGNRDGLAAVIDLADKCRTSFEAAAIRYVELANPPTGILVCTGGKVEYCSTFNLAREVGWATPLRRNSRVPMDSATWRLANDSDAVRSCLQDSESAQACDWFSNASPKAWLTEETIGLGRTGKTLTLLTLDGIEEDDESEEWDEPRFKR